jgi:hypothetical protein
MSAWVIGLGLAAGYLINKKMAIVSQLETSTTEFNSAAKPATGGVTTAEVRSAWKRTDHVKYGDMNSDLPRKQMDELVAGEEKAASAVEQFDQGQQTPHIQGVMLHYDRLGV